jgi:hypothetical protein
MSVAFDAVSTGQGLTSYSATHTPSGTPTAVLVGATNDGRGLTMTYGGAAMTLLASVSSPDATTTQWLFGLANPAAGAQSVSPTWTGTAETAIGTITVTGSLLTAAAFGTPITNSANSGNASGSLTVLTGGSLALAVVGNNHPASPVAAAWSGASPGTERYNFRDSGPWEDIAGQTSAAGGTLTFAWTNNNTGTTAWGLVAVEIRSVLTGTPTMVLSSPPWVNPATHMYTGLGPFTFGLSVGHFPQPMASTLVMTQLVGGTPVRTATRTIPATALIFGGTCAHPDTNLVFDDRHYLYWPVGFDLGPTSPAGSTIHAVLTQGATTLADATFTL